MKTWAEIIADRLDEMGRIKDMGRPAILDTEREAAEIIRFMQRRIAELEKENTSLKNHISLSDQTVVLEPLTDGEIDAL